MKKVKDKKSTIKPAITKQLQDPDISIEEMQRAMMYVIHELKENGAIVIRDGDTINRYTPTEKFVEQIKKLDLKE